MPAIALPENASLEHLKKQAKLIRQLVVAGDAGALQLLEEFHPRHRTITAETCKLADAQLVVARLYGHASWGQLRAHLDLVEEFSRPDPVDRESTDDADAVDRFVALSCVSYNGDHDPADRVDAARKLLAADASLATASVASMAVTGERDALAERLFHDPSIRDAPCGPNEWPPILYCCFSRLDGSDSGRSTLATAQMLLDAGADPNAGFLWRGLVPPFTALTGAFGGGEADQPPHPAALDLARALLETGADPNDGQALYNNGLAGSAHDDPTHLELLVEFGLGANATGPWYRRFGDRLTPPGQLLYDEVEVAAHRGLPRRMQFLVDLGLDLSRAVGRSQQTPWRLASGNGHTDVLEVLRQAGVEASSADSG